MALFVNQNSNRTKLQERLAAELTDKAKKKAEIADKERPDGVTDSAYMEGTKKTTSLMGVWLAVAVIGLGVVIAVIWGFSQ